MMTSKMLISLVVSLLGVATHLMQLPQGDQHQVLSAVAPAFPPIAAAARATGEVSVEVRIDPTGAVSSAQAEGHPLLRGPSQEAAKRWKFAPAGKGAAPRTARLTFAFGIPEKEMPAADVTPVFRPPYRIEVARNIPR